MIKAEPAGATALWAATGSMLGEAQMAAAMRAAAEQTHRLGTLGCQMDGRNGPMTDNTRATNGSRDLRLWTASADIPCRP